MFFDNEIYFTAQYLQTGGDIDYVLMGVAPGCPSKGAGLIN